MEETTTAERIISYIGATIIFILFTPCYFIGFLIGTIVAAIRNGYENQFE